MRSKIGDKQRLQHILDAITEIETYTSKIDFDQFADYSMMRFACIKQIEIIGEAANYITPETKQKFNNIQWHQIIGMRHILVHEYFGIDIELIWQIIARDIPALKVSANEILLGL